MSSEQFFIVYTKPKCPYCTLAVDLLNEHGKIFDVVDLLQDQKSMSYIKGRGCTTVPQVFTATQVGRHLQRKELIGGHADLVKYFKKKN
ncbi:hypothetical protein [Alishewanella phage vB_AspM_Slickus01]|nr:hypothetical protein [Alishewanella phage vB_AspM_Slickus01]